MRAILCEPGYQARYIDIDGTDASVMKAVGGSFVREYLTDSVYVIRSRHDKDLKPNRRHMDDEDVFYKGNILFVAAEGELSLVDRLFVMGQFMDPDFIYPIRLGMKEGDEIQVIKGIDFKNKRPDRIVVKKEFEHFISAEFYFGGHSYRFSLNKASILNGELEVRKDGVDLRQLMYKG